MLFYISLFNNLYINNRRGDTLVAKHPCRLLSWQVGDKSVTPPTIDV